MIIVIGNVTVKADSLDLALELSRAHVARSRLEPGCLEHGISIDSENPNRLVFVERWESMEYLEQHFQVPESGAFVAALSEIATEAPKLSMFESEEVRRH